MEQDHNKVREASHAFKHFAAQPDRLKPIDAAHVPVKEAKAKLTELLRKVEAGERIVLTRHGKPVADLVPHMPDSAAEKMSVLERYELWRKDNPPLGIGWVADDFDEQLPEDFLLQPLPDDCDEILEAGRKEIAAARARLGLQPGGKLAGR